MGQKQILEQIPEAPLLAPSIKLLEAAKASYEHLKIEKFL